MSMDWIFVDGFLGELKRVVTSRFISIFWLFYDRSKELGWNRPLYGLFSLI